MWSFDDSFMFAADVLSSLWTTTTHERSCMNKHPARQAPHVNQSSTIETRRLAAAQYHAAPLATHLTETTISLAPSVPARQDYQELWDAVSHTR